MACLWAHCFGFLKDKEALQAKAIGDDVSKATSKPMKGKEGKKTMEILVLDGTMETPAVTCRDIIPWVAAPASPWVLKAQQKEVEKVAPLDLSDITTVELLLLVNPHRGREWACEAKLQGPGKETWQAEVERCQCLHDGMSVLEALALISPRHMKDHQAEQRRAQKAAADIEAFDRWFDDMASAAAPKRQARNGWFGRAVLLLAVLLFACCFVAASDPAMVSGLLSIVESGRTAAVSVVESGRTAAVSVVESGSMAAASAMESAVSALSAFHHRLKWGGVTRGVAFTALEAGPIVPV